MKKYLSLLLCIVMMLSLVCSCDKNDTKVEEVATDTELSERLGFTMDIPDTAKYASFSIINTTMGEARFTFNSYVFVYRASKLSADKSLYEIDSDVIGTINLTIDERAEVAVQSFAEGGRVAVWNYGGTNYTLYTQKGATDDAFTELLDLIIK